MYKDLDNEKYDFLILGTSLTETALSAYLAKTKKKLIQIDISKSYGGDCKNFNLRDMEKFMNEIKVNSSKDSSIKNISFINRKVKEDLEPVAEKENFRQYNFDLNPKFIYAKSKSSAELIDSKASNYIEFNSVRKIFFMFNDQFLNVPFSKSEIFISNDLDLLEKQKLLNFIFSVMKLKNNNVDVNSTVDIKKDIELDDDFLFNEIKKNLQTKAIDFLKKNFNEKINDMILLILANQTLNSQNMTVDQMCDKIYKFLISVQIYDKTPFLTPLYGSSEFAQAMSRLSAVNGSIFLINDLLSCNINYNKEYNKDDKDSRRFLVEINDEEKNEKFKINVDKIIVNNCYLDDNKSQIKFSEDIKIKSNSNDFVYKYCSFFIIKSITELNSFKDGPFYYRVPKNNTLLKNEYQLDAIRYFNNTSVIPNNRTMIQVSIMSNLNEKDKDEFIKKAKEISENFIKKIVDDLKEDILKNYNNEEFKKNCKFNRMRIIEEINEEEEKKKKEEEERKKKEEEERIKKEEEEKKKKEEEERKKKEEEEKKKKEEEEKKKKEEDEKKGNEGEKKEEGDKKDEEKKEDKKEEKKENSGAAVYVPPRRPRTPPKIEDISLTPEIIITYEVEQKIPMSDYNIDDKEKDNYNIIFTKNNFISVDLDDYFDESFNILKQSKLIENEEKKEDDKKEEKEEAREAEDDDDIEDNNLIDELFGEIENNEDENGEDKKEEDKKDGDKKEENKNEEEKKEENKKDGEKKEEDKKEEEKKEEGKKEDEKKEEDKKEEEKKEEDKK